MRVKCRWSGKGNSFGVCHLQVHASNQPVDSVVGGTKQAQICLDESQLPFYRLKDICFGSPHVSEAYVYNAAKCYP